MLRHLASRLTPVVVAGLLLAPLLSAEPAHPLYLDSAQPLNSRVEDLLHRLTLDEKLSLVHGSSKFATAGIPRLGIPALWMSDGPHGVREQISANSWNPAGWTNDFSTYMPVAIALASTWNPGLGRAYGAVIGQEARARGKDIMLGPGLNIQRTPLCGRNFEYMGEDPFLTSQMAVGYIEGEQSQGVSSCAKHFACNNQEWDRNSINVEVSERALREIYLPAFRAAVQQGHVWSVMAAYNKFRGVHCAENGPLLNGILKGEWGFQGLVVSDWGAAHSTEGAVRGGLDLEMGTTGRRYDDYYLADPFKKELLSGKYPMSLLDDKVRRVLRVMLAIGAIGDAPRPAGSINTKAHELTARRVAEQAIVLLKNEAGLLPLDPTRIHSIAVIGENATKLQAHAGESSAIKAFYEINPLAGILNRVGSQVNVTYSLGYGENAGPDALGRAVAAARSADVAIVVGGLNHNPGFDCEGTDRTSLDLPYGQDELIRRVAAANPRTIVVLIAGSPVVMDGWLGQVPAVLDAWYPGMEGGNAIAAVLFGDVNPSGKLPCTFPRRLADSPAHALDAYPGTEGVVHYKEGLLVGYRWYDTRNITPLFPFGYGLSYTTFAYSNLRIFPGSGGSASVSSGADTSGPDSSGAYNSGTSDSGAASSGIGTSGSGSPGSDSSSPVAIAQFTLTNTGQRAGAETAELYIHEDHAALFRPEKELKGFQKVYLSPGESKTVSISLPWRSFSYYDPVRHAWVAQSDTFQILLGSSSRDIRETATFTLPHEITAP